MIRGCSIKVSCSRPSKNFLCRPSARLHAQQFSDINPLKFSFRVIHCHVNSSLVLQSYSGYKNMLTPQINNKYIINIITINSPTGDFTAVVLACVNHGTLILASLLPARFLVFPSSSAERVKENK